MKKFIIMLTYVPLLIGVAGCQGGIFESTCDCKEIRKRSMASDGAKIYAREGEETRYTGKCTERYFSNDQLKYLRDFKDGRAVHAEVYYENGQKAVEQFFEDGVEVKRKYWHQNGQLRTDKTLQADYASSGSFINDPFFGSSMFGGIYPSKEYYENGSLMSEMLSSDDYMMLRVVHYNEEGFVVDLSTEELLEFDDDWFRYRIRGKYKDLAVLDQLLADEAERRAAEREAKALPTWMYTD